MEPFPWSDVFAVGNELLDDEHRQMVGIINQVCIGVTDARREDSLSLLARLQFLSEQHFRHEEELLASIHAGIDIHSLRTMVNTAITAHTREHRQKLDELQKLTERWHAASAGADELALCDELKAWFVDHTVGYEAQIKTILQSTGYRSDASGSGRRGR